MLLTAVSGRRFSRGAAIAALAACATGVGAGACGGAGTGSATGAGGRVSTYPVRVASAGFPPRQHLAQTVRLVIAVRNVGTATLPNVALTITDPPYGTSAQAFSVLSAPQSGLASRSRPVWIIDRPPGPCGYSCRNGGPGAAVTAFANTWALGPLAPGRVATFAWTLTAVAPGTYHVAYRVAAALDGRSRAVLPGGRPAAGGFTVQISKQIRTERVNDQGQVVYGP